MGYGHGALGLPTLWHLLLGLTAVILSVSAHCLIFGIFTGSGKDTRELVQDLHLDPTYTARTKSFRPVVFPPALYAILLLVVAAVMGGALGAHSQSLWLRWGHGLLMWFTVLYNLRAFFIEYQAVKENAQILASLNREAGATVGNVATPAFSTVEPVMLSAAAEHHEWGAHVFALGKFLCFLGWNVWLPFIYLKYIVGYFMMPVWPYLLGSLALLGGGQFLKYRYRAFRPAQARWNRPQEA